MYTIQPLVSTESLKTSLLGRVPENRSPLRFHYDRDLDSLMLLIVSPDTETIVHYMDENVALLYIPESREIVGLQIEDFASDFVPRYQSLQRKWSMKQSGITSGNFGDLTIAVDERKMEVACEVMKVAESRVGSVGKELERAFEYACA